MNNQTQSFLMSYQLFLILQGSNNQYSYEIELTEAEENNPEPRLEQDRSKIKTKIEQEIKKKEPQPRKLRDKDLNDIIKKWAFNIKNGFPDLKLPIDLPIMTDEDIEKIQENGYQDLPELVAPDIKEIEPPVVILPPLEF